MSLLSAIDQFNASLISVTFFKHKNNKTWPQTFE